MQKEKNKFKFFSGGDLRRTLLKDKYFIDKDNTSKFNYSFDMRMWFPETLNRILTDCNYNIQKFYGDYDCNTFNEDSEKQIYLCNIYI